MSRIIKEFWEFKDNQILKPYRLGQIIDLKNESENLKKSADNDFDYEYAGAEKFLWTITIRDNRITRIIYRKNFPIPNYEFWENDYHQIRKELEVTHRRVDANYTGEKMCIIYRDYFVTLIFLQ
jgi:hypothetical protein